MIEPMIYVGLPTSQQNFISKNIESVFEAIFKTMGVSKSKLIGRSHFPLLVDSRIFFAWVLKNKFHFTSAQIAKELHRERTTISYYFEVFDARLETEPTFRRNHEAVLTELGKRF
ncbi:hypothetical protein GCM10009120_18580 [Sphingobacterium siyangense subsp. cladoniae]|uniref:hypothetical protein n=1 Tax=Sphingobacterium siyangense TaxID=459529 RepID=UPI0031F92582